MPTLSPAGARGPRSATATALATSTPRPTGLGLLEQNERHSRDALFHSLTAGRVDDVIDALITYRNAHIERKKK